MQQSVTPWGQHLVLDLAGGPRHRFTDRNHLIDWLGDLLATTEMKALGKLTLGHFTPHTPNAAGDTVVQPFESSNECAHFAENLGQGYIDIFRVRRSTAKPQRQFVDAILSLALCNKMLLNHGAANPTKAGKI